VDGPAGESLPFNGYLVQRGGLQQLESFHNLTNGGGVSYCNALQDNYLSPYQLPAPAVMCG